MGEWIKAFFSNAFWAVVFYYIGPVGAVVLTGATITAGWIEHLPWAITLPLGGFMFAALGTGLLRFDEWRERRSAANRLRYMGAQMLVETTRDQAGNPTHITRAQPVIHFQSFAAFPISVVVEEMQNTLAGHVYQGNEPDIKQVEFGLLEQKQFRDHPFDMQQTPVTPQIEGTIRFRLRYGHKGRENQILDKRLRITCGQFNPILGVYMEHIPLETIQ